MTTVLKAKLTRAINSMQKIRDNAAANDDVIKDLTAKKQDKKSLQEAQGLITASVKQFKTGLQRLKQVEQEWMTYIASLPQVEKLDVEETFAGLVQMEDGLYEQYDEVESSIEILEENLFIVQQTVLTLSTLEVATGLPQVTSNVAHTAAIAAQTAAQPAANAAHTAAPNAASNAAHTAAAAAAHTVANFAPVPTARPVFNDPSAGFQIKLPQMQLGTFSGNPRDWPRFWNTFDACVDSRAVPDIVKLNYLISCLTDSASEAVKGYDVCADNYSLVKNTLLDRFGNEEKIVEQLYRELHSLRTPGESRTEARKFVDDLEAILHQLERRNINTNDVPTMMSVEKILPKWMKPYIFTMKMTDPHLSLTKLRAAMKTMVQISIDDRDDRDEKTHYTTMAAVTSPPAKKTIKSSQSYKSNKPGDNSSAKSEDKKILRCVLCTKHVKSAECRTYDTLDKRKTRIKELNLCFRCNTTGHRSADCRKKIDKCKCGKLHNPVLCFPKENEKTTTVAVASSKPKEIEHLVAHPAGNKEVALMTAEVVLENPVTGQQVKTLAFFDCGSQMSFVTNELASAMQLPNRKKESMDVKIFNGPTRTIQYSCQTIKLLEINGQKKIIEVKSIDTIVQSMKSIRLQQESTDEKKLNHLSIVSETRTPHLIIGNDYYWSVVKSKTEQLENGFEVIDSTVGKMLAGRRSSENEPTNVFTILTPIATPAIVDHQLDQLLKDSFELDTIGITDSPDVNDDEVAWELFEKSVKFEDGRYVCSLPWKEPEPNLPTNQGLAYSQLQGCKSRFTKRPELITALKQIIYEWVEKGIIEKVPEEEMENPKGMVHYLPYPIVETPNKTTTKKRLVHNASAKTKGNPSLNELLYRGPVILPDLAGLMIRFREYKEVVIGDLEKAFLQLTLNDKDRDVLRFLIPNDWTKPFDTTNLEVYRFKRVNFGVISSPFLLAGAIRIHLKKHDTPLDREMLMNTYVDNVLMEASDTSEANEKATAAHARFEEATMNLRDFVSSDDAFNEKWCKEVPSEISFLGLKWSPQPDTVKISIPQMLFDNPTKRKILKKTAAVFDPLGLVAPALLPFRLFIQDLWKTKKGWDSQLEEVQLQSLKILVDRDTGTTISLPRRIINNKHSHTLHIFVDASKKSFAACAYLKDMEESSPPQLIFAKIRLAPMKEVSIPRLELLALEIGTRLEKFIKSHSSTRITSTTIWSDSQCVLSWIRSKKESLPRFVANRIRKIEDSDATFNYIGTKSNPADVASRGCSSTELQNDALWWNGPTWLALTPEQWPNQPTHLFALDAKEAEEEIDNVTSMSVIAIKQLTPNPDAITVNPTRFSTWTKMINTATRVIHFGQLLKKAEPKTSSRSEVTSRLRKKAKRWIIRECQARQPPTAEQIGQLRLYLDNDGIWRSHGRIENSDSDFNMKNPIFLSKKDYATKLLVLHYHVRHHHSSSTHTLAQLRTNFWIPQARNFVKQVMKESCMKCRRLLAKPYKAPEMPQLPTNRVTAAPPFERTGVDYAGPFNVRQNSAIIKTWICLFTCLVTRVCHLELVTDLTSSSFLTSLRRFVARRGRPNFFISDNGTNFRGAFRAVTEGWTEQCDQDVTTYCSTENMNWKFIPSLSPWFGGVYERMVGIMKRSLSQAVGNRLLSYDLFWTLVTETEAIINSRPLVYVTEEHRALRPIDFIMPNAAIGTPTSAEEADEEYRETRTTHDQLTSQWCQSRKILDCLWKTWNNEYLSSLRERYNYQLKQGRSTARTEPVVGEVVILGDEQQKRGQWKLATIEAVPASQDGAVRSVFVRTSNGRRLHRAIAQVYPLEIRPPAEESTELDNNQEPSNPTNNDDQPLTQDIPDQNEATETKYNLRPRKNRPTYSFFVLAVLTVFGTVDAGTCPRDVPVSRVYQQECTNSGMVIYQINSSSSYCWEKVTCGNSQHLRKLKDTRSDESICGPQCQCPTGAAGCTFHTTPHNVSMDLMHRWLNTLRPTVCSYVCSKECPREVFSLVHQVVLEDGTRRYISHLNIVRTQHKGEEAPRCFGDGLRTGTADYCAQNPCTKNGTQFCLYQYNEYAYLVTEQGNVPITAWYSENITVFERQNPDLKLNSVGCNKVNISCSEEGIDIEHGLCVPDVIQVCLNNSTPQKCRFFNFLSESVTISLPSTRLLTDYTVLVKLWDRGIIQHTTGIVCTKKELCEVANCIICWSNYYHSHCILENVGRALLHSLVILTVLASLAFFLWKLLHNRWPCRHTFFGRRRRFLPTRLSDKIILLTVITATFLPIAVPACGNVISFQANDSSCQSSPNGHLSCNYNQVTSITMTSDSEACILLKDSDSRPMGTLQLTLNNKMICEKKNVFFTTPIDIKSASSKRCPGMSLCSGQTCSNLQPTDHVPELSVFETFPGKNYCEESCSCVTCGCFSCAAACMFYRVYAVPLNNDIYTVFQCDWKNEVEIIAALHTSSGSQEQHFKLPLGGSSKGDKLTIGVQNTASLFEFDRKAQFLQFNDRIAILSLFGRRATEVFQCTQEKVDNQTCAIREDSCHCRQADSGIACLCTDNKLLQKELKENALPQFKLGTALENLNNQVHISVDAAVTLIVKAEDLIGQTKVELSTCSMETVELQGCFSCEDGAHIEYVCVTDFGKQLAHVQCESFEFTAVCDTKQEPRKTTTTINAGVVKETCNISCPGSTKKFNVNGNLYYVSSLEEWNIKDRSMVEGRSLLQMAQSWIQETADSLEKLVITIIVLVVLLKVAKLVVKKLIVFLF